MADLVSIPSGTDGPGAGFTESPESQFRPVSEPTFAELVEAWHGPVYAFALCLMGEPAEAARLTQLTFGRWIEREEHGMRQGQERRWLFAALYHEFARASARRADELTLDRPGPTPAGPFQHIQHLRPTEIVAALQRVQIAARAPLAFLYAGNFTVSEIAEILEQPIAEVMERLASGKAQLARALVQPDEAATQQPAA